MGLGAVMAAAEGREIARMRLAGWTAEVRRQIGLDVVEVAGAGPAPAAGEHAPGITEAHQVGHPGRRVMSVDGVGASEVEHRTDHERGAGEPGVEHVEQHRAALVGTEHRHHGRVGGDPVEVVGGEVEDHRGGHRGGARVAPGEEVEGPLRVGQDADRVGTAYVERVVVTESPQRLGTTSHRGVERLGVGGVEHHQDVCRQRRGARSKLDLARGQRGQLVVDLAVGIEVEPGLVHQPADPHPVDVGRVG